MFNRLSNFSAVSPLTSTKENGMNTSFISATNHSNFDKTMSSREIAELTDKEHKNVCRDIQHVLETLSGTKEIDRLKFEPISYRDSYGREQPMYLLDFEATMLVISGYDTRLRAKIIHRWHELEAEKYEAQSVTQVSTQPFSRNKLLAEEFEGAKKLATLFGLEGNQALLKADKVIKQQYGISPMTLLEIELKSPDNEALMIATEIGKRLDPAVSAKAVNLALAAMDFMERFEYRAGKFEWRLTEKGKEYGVYLDTGKVHSNGTPIQQIKWRESVISLIQQYLSVQG